MKISASCMGCIVNRQLSQLKECKDEEKKSAYMKRAFKLMGESPAEASAPVLVTEITRIYEEMFGAMPSFDEKKHFFNQKMLREEDSIRARIVAEADPLRMAAALAGVGNYIDFGTIKDVEESVLDRLLQMADPNKLPEETWNTFCQDLRSRKKLVYLTDNCGEVLLDKLFIEQIKAYAPDLRITVLVRGEPALNDATMEDAREVGLTDVVPVYGNGNGIPGTEYSRLSAQAKALIDQADMLISKGQGNFETFYGNGFHTYYLFLCKCNWFVSRFHMELHGEVFMTEEQIGQMEGQA